MPAPTPPPPPTDPARGCREAAAFKCLLLPRGAWTRVSPGEGAAWGRALGENCQSSQVFNVNPPSPAPAAAALRPEPSRRRPLGWTGSCSRQARGQVAAAREAVAFKHKGSEGRGGYVKITGTVIAFYINVLFKSSPQCASPSLKGINSRRTNLFRAYRWSIMQAPPSTPDGELSGCHLTQLPVSLHRDEGQRAPCETLGLRAAPRGPWGPQSRVRMEESEQETVGPQEPGAQLPSL